MKTWDVAVGALRGKCVALNAHADRGKAKHLYLKKQFEELQMKQDKQNIDVKTAVYEIETCSIERKTPAFWKGK